MQKRKYKLCQLAIGLVLAIATAAENFTQPVVAAEDACDDVQFIFARGSGEHLEDISFRAWRDNIINVLEGTKLKYSFYELGTSNYGGYQYPAVTVSDGFWGGVNLVSAYFTGGDAWEFGKSVAQGMGELKAYIRQTSASCKRMEYVLGGYSQGAMVMTQTLPELDAYKIVYVTTFGDPKLYLPEGKHNGWEAFKPVAACRGLNLSPYRAYVPDCYAYEGVLGSQRPYQPPFYDGKIGTWCNQSDIMCSSGMSIDDHTKYIQQGLYGDAAQYIRNKLRKAFPVQTGVTESSGFRVRHDVAFLFDLTGSMKSRLEQYKDEARKLAAAVWEKGGRVALYGYRDLAEPNPLAKICDLGCSPQEFEEHLSQMRVVKGAGGDAPESLLYASYQVMSLLSWRLGATKSLVILTDAEYHSPDLDGTTLADVVKLSLAIDPVNFYVIAPAYTREYYTELTQQTNGRFFNIDTDLAFSTTVILGRPVAILSLPEYTGVVGDEFEFDAGASYGFGTADLTYDWDLDGDGEFELVNAGAKVQKKYTTTFNGFVQVRLSDDAGSSTMSAAVKVNAAVAPEALAQVKIVEAKKLDTQTEIKLSSVSAAKVLLTMDDAVMGFVDLEQGKFQLDNLKKDTMITLTAYSETGRRGTSDSMMITQDGEVKTEETEEGSGTTTMAPSTSGNVNVTKTPEAILPKAPETTVIPKAPDTGTKAK